jgi:hypothetical protein
MEPDFVVQIAFQPSAVPQRQLEQATDARTNHSLPPARTGFARIPITVSV